jgi:peptide/nickel transport system ATP-binding protein
MAEPLLALENIHVRYGTGSKATHAVRGVDLQIARGETLGLVGESGCGKSSLGRAILQFPRPDEGRVLFDGVDLATLRGERLREMRPQLQMIFQDPVSSLNPRRKVLDIVIEPLRIWKRGTASEQRQLAEQVLLDVGIDPVGAARRYPQEYSGGQCQRICIARALVLRPKLLLCDEPVSALDVSIRAQVLNLLEDVKRSYGLTVLFVAHDLAVVKNVSDRIAVMRRGEIIEVAAADELYERPQTEYTRALIEAIPMPDPRVRPEPFSRVDVVET